MDLTIIQKIAIWVIPLVFAITLHEVAHGWIASLFGDPTARMMGRLTINPVKHVDIIGTIIVPLVMLMISNFIFGWAKPVPVDPRNFRHPHRGGHHHGRGPDGGGGCDGRCQAPRGPRHLPPDRRDHEPGLGVRHGGLSPAAADEGRRGRGTARGSVRLSRLGATG